MTILVLVAVLQWRALARVPLAAYGVAGAELIPHLQRLYGERFLEADGLLTLLNPWHVLRGLDGHYPALLHLVAATGRRLGLGGEGRGFEAVTHLNLVYLGLLAWGTGVVARGVLVVAPARLPSWGVAGVLTLRVPGLAAGVLTLLVPGLAMAARRYYYDLPMTTALFLVAALLSTGRGLRCWPRAIGAGVLTAIALLFKWAAALYLAPIWLVALSVGLYQARDPQSKIWSAGPWWTLIRGLTGGAVAGALVWPVASKPAGSFTFQARAGLGEGVSSPLLWERLQFYGHAVLEMGFGPGLGASLVLATLCLVAFRQWRLLAMVGAVTLLPLIYVLARVPVMDGRYLMPLLPWGAVLLAAAWDQLRLRWGSQWALGVLVGLCGVGVGQLLYADGIVGADPPSSSSPDGGGTVQGAPSGGRGDLPPHAIGDASMPGGPAGVVPGHGSAGRPASSPTRVEGRWGRLSWPVGWRVSRPERGGHLGEEQARGTHAQAQVSWAEWWWTGARLDRPSSTLDWEAVVLAALQLIPGARVYLGELPGQSFPVHGWQFFVNGFDLPSGSLVAPPEGRDLATIVGNLADHADVVVGLGPEARPAVLSGWLRQVFRAPGEASKAAEVFASAFPRWEAVEIGALEVHLYAAEVKD